MNQGLLIKGQFYPVHTSAHEDMVLKTGYTEASFLSCEISEYTHPQISNESLI